MTTSPAAPSSGAEVLGAQVMLAESLCSTAGGRWRCGPARGATSVTREVVSWAPAQALSFPLRNLLTPVAA